MISDLDIWRSANELIKQFGDTADIEAAARADELLDKGDLEGQRVWLRILNGDRRTAEDTFRQSKLIIMCGRYSITLPPEAIRELFQTHGELPNWPAYYNAAPTTALPVVRQAKDGGGRELVLMQWGLIPWFSKDGKPSYSTINARAEGVQTCSVISRAVRDTALHRAGIGIFRMDRAEERSTAALLHAR